MSIYIEGIDMPKDGYHHMICIYADGTVSTGGRVYKGIPVPPHGRLIDADALIKGIEADVIWKYNAINEYDSGIRTGARAVMRSVRNAPTVIPASEEEI